jgi:hypothetical protein
MGVTLGKKVKLLAPGQPAIWCPACKTAHRFPTDDSNVINGRVHKWTFNGDGDRPTFTPSMHISPSQPEHTCHSFVTDGMIQFLPDCYHTLKGQTVELPDWPESESKFWDFDDEDGSVI